jgi:hypothetical protein
MFEPVTAKAHHCTMQATMQLRVVRCRFVAYASVKIVDTMLVNGVEQLHTCIECGKEEWSAVEEVERG